MPQACLKRARPVGLACVLGSELRRIDDELALYGGNAGQLEQIKRTIGLDQRRVAPPGVTALDLGAQAARQLLSDLKIEAASLDAVIFVTQSPDHFQPCNATLLHGRLALRNAAAAFDVNLGCSGFIYGLYLASLMVETGGCARVLLVAGDTLSHAVHPRDRSVAPVFGDAAAAILIEQIPAGEPDAPAWFNLYSDGQGAGIIRQPAGAFREPLTPAAQQETTDEDGNIRTRAHLHMQGAEVLAFSLREVPPAITAILQHAGLAAGAVDAFVFHQANRFVISNIARRLKLPADRVPLATVEKYGNQSSASIPVTIADALAARIQAVPLRLVLCGFGVGLSWAAACVSWGPLRVCRLEPYTP